MQSFKEYMKEFITDESGIETLEVAVAIAISAGLIALIRQIYAGVKGQMESAQDEINSAFGE